MNKNCEKCFVCDDKTLIHLKNVENLLSKYTETPILRFLKKFVGKDYFDLHTEEIQICQQCLLKLDEYDLASSTALKVEQELIQLLNTKQNKNIDVLENECSTIKKEIIDIKYELNQGNVSLICNICFMKFDSISKLNEHTHQNNIDLEEFKKEPSSDDTEEDEDIPSTKKIKTVKQTLNEGQQKFVCYICGLTCKSRNILNGHISTHQELSSHECKICKKRFSQKGALRRHMPIHTRDKFYQCEICGKQFIHPSSFRMHKLAHDNVREKKCTICGLRLRSSSHLNRHLRVHTGEKPHTCPTCGQTFAQRYNMKAHFKIHQGETRTKKSYSCPICNLIFFVKKKFNEHITSVHNMTLNNIKTENVSSIEETTKTSLGTTTTIINNI